MFLFLRNCYRHLLKLVFGFRVRVNENHRDRDVLFHAIKWLNVWAKIALFMLKKYLPYINRFVIALYMRVAHVEKKISHVCDS